MYRVEKEKPTDGGFYWSKRYLRPRIAIYNMDRHDKEKHRRTWQAFVFLRSKDEIFDTLPNYDVLRLIGENWDGRKFSKFLKHHRDPAIFYTKIKTA